MRSCGAARRPADALADLPLAHVLFVVWEDPLITIGQNTFIADALRWAGAESVICRSELAADELRGSGAPAAGLHRFHEQPSGASGELLADLRSRPDWKGLQAVEMGHVVNVSDEIARPSPGLVDAIEELARDVHPEAFSIRAANSAPDSKMESARHLRDIARLPRGASCLRPLTPRRVLGICLLLLAVLFVAVVLSLRMGAYPISVRDIVATLFNGALGRRDQIPSEFWLVVFGLRLPRIVLGILVGAALSTSGAGFQALLRNPLADPYVLGVSSGAALGAILSLIVAPLTPGLIQLAAFAGATATITAVYFLGRRDGQLDSTTLLLAGIISASFLSAVIMFLMTTLSGRDLRGMAFWLMGDLSSPPAVDLRWLYLLLLIAAGSIYTTSSDLNLILTGEHEARHLGVDVTRVKLVVYVSASLLTGLAVSVSGAIGYVGLLVPHVMRMLFRHRLPAADSDVGDWRRDRHRAGGYAGAHDCGAHGIAGRRDDGDGRRAGVHLFDAAEACGERHGTNRRLSRREHAQRPA